MSGHERRFSKYSGKQSAVPLILTTRKMQLIFLTQHGKIRVHTWTNFMGLQCSDYDAILKITMSPKYICIEIAVKFMRSELHIKLEQLVNETYKTSQLVIAAKVRMHLIVSLIKLNTNSETSMHRCFLENFIKT